MQVSKRLIVHKEIPIDTSKELLNSLDASMADYYCRQGNFARGLELFRGAIEKTYNEKDRINLTNKYLNAALFYGRKLFSEKNYIEAVEQYREMMKYSGFPITIYKQIGLCMKELGDADLAIKFLKRFEETSPDKEDVYIYLADITYGDIKDNERAIEYYEKALVKNPNNFGIYNMLGHLYSTCYQDKFKEKQIYYLKKAFELAPNNRIVVKNLAYVYGKFDETQKADEMYQKLMYLNPTHSDLHAYGAYLVKHRRFSEGFKFLQHRFLKEDLGNIAFPELLKTKKKKWNMKLDISNKVILAHFEQGFGDSIMFARFIEGLKQRCKDVIFVVQNSLIELMKDSDLGVEVYSENEIPRLNYDLWVPLMDLPIICETQPNNIPKAEGYLKVPKEKIEAYRKQHINNNNKIKIGIAYEGTLASKETDRDIPLEFLYPLMRLPDVEVYSFQVDDLTRQMDRIPPDANLIRLGKTFGNWEDTACAMNCMDLMVTTDNGVMNLAGALGVKTFGLFNKITEWRWIKTTGDDIAWYKSIRPFQAPTSKAWDIPMKQVMEEVNKLVSERKKASAAKEKTVKAVKTTRTAKTEKVSAEAKPKKTKDKEEKGKTTPKTKTTKNTKDKK